MKYKLLFLILILTQICFSQEDVKFRLDSEAIFPNGFGALYQKIKENLVYPQSALMQGKQGKVFIEFTIGADGYIIESSVKSIETFDEDCARSAEATLKSIKTKWTPAKLNGLPTLQKLVIPVVFSLEDIDLTSEPQSNEPLSSDLQITDEVFEIKAIIVPKIGMPKKIDWPIYKDMNMNEQIGSLLPGDSVKIIGWGAWVYKISRGNKEGYISWKAVDSKEDLTAIRKKIELHSDELDKKLAIADSLKNLQLLAKRDTQHPILMDSTSKVFLKLSSSKANMEVGDCSVIELALYISYRNNLRLQIHDVWTTLSQINSIIQLINCWYSPNQITTIKSEDVTINGQGYSKYQIFKGGLCTIASGNIIIPPITLTLIKYKDMSDKVGTLVSLKSNTVKLKTQMPTILTTSDFYSPVGNFTLTDSVYESPDHSINYSFTVEGSGFTFPLKAPQIKWLNGYGALVKTKFSDTVVNNTYYSSKTFHYILNFTKTGQYSLSESVRFGFYHPDQKNVYKIQSSKSVIIQEKNLLPIPKEISFTKDKIIVMDISRSMQIEDYKPYRLAVVKAGISDFTKTYQLCDLGIIVFGGEAYQLHPDLKNNCYSNSSLANINFGQIKNGTAIGNGIFLAIESISKTGNDKRIVVIGDGDNTAGPVPINVAISLAKKYGIKVYSIGIGNRGKVPFGKAADGATNYVNDTFSDTDLMKIAVETGGKYFWAKDGQAISSALNQIFVK